MTAPTIHVNGVDVVLTDARRRALAVLATGPARVAAVTDPRARTVDWRTVGSLTMYGLAVAAPSRQVWLTTRGQQAAGIALRQRRRA